MLHSTLPSEIPQVVVMEQGFLSSVCECNTLGCLSFSLFFNFPPTLFSTSHRFYTNILHIKFVDPYPYLSLFQKQIAIITNLKELCTLIVYTYFVCNPTNKQTNKQPNQQHSLLSESKYICQHP